LFDALVFIGGRLLGMKKDRGGQQYWKDNQAKQAKIHERKIHRGGMLAWKG
jgi:hypothetical protein